MKPDRVGFYFALLGGIYGELVVVRVYNPFNASRDGRVSLLAAYVDRDGKSNALVLDTPDIFWLGAVAMPPNLSAKQLVQSATSNGLQDARS